MSKEMKAENGGRYVEGPWTNEPDELDFVEAGLKCALRRGPVGCWNGYVGVPKAHPLYGKSYDDAMDEGITAHGGLTYAGDGWWGKDGLWWFGFDTAHHGDWMPPIADFGAKYPEYRKAHLGQTYKTLEYTQNELRELAVQLKVMTSLTARLRALWNRIRKAFKK